MEVFEPLTEESLRASLKTHSFGHPLYYLLTIDSTNDYAKRAAGRGASEGTLVVSEEQTKGRGRRGRSWFSPPGTAILMSLILRPELEPFETAGITLITAVAVSEAIFEVTELEAGIKWPNDIIIAGKKAGGILTEAGKDTDGRRYLIVGIGLNVNTGKFPEELRGKATSLRLCRGREVSRRELLIAVIAELERFYFNFIKTGRFSRIINRYREKSVTIGRRVKLIRAGREFEARAIDVTDKGGLLIKRDNGEIEEILSGEVSIR